LADSLLDRPWSDDYLSQVDDVRMRTSAQGLDLAKAGDGEAFMVIVVAIELQTLQSDNLP